VKVKDLVNLKFDKNEISEIAKNYDEIKPLKLVENRLYWERLRDVVMEEVLTGNRRPMMLKIANEVLSAFDKSLRDADSVKINILNVDKRQIVIKVKGQNTKKVFTAGDDGIDIKEEKVEISEGNEEVEEEKEEEESGGGRRL